MAHFYGTLKGSRGEATRCGSKSSGLVAYAASWQGAIRSEVFVTDGQGDWCRVELVPWHGNGVSRLLYEGPIGR